MVGNLEGELGTVPDLHLRGWEARVYRC